MLFFVLLLVHRKLTIEQNVEHLEQKELQQLKLELEIADGEHDEAQKSYAEACEREAELEKILR